MNISILFPVVLILGLLINGCAEISTSVDSQENIIKNEKEFKNNQNNKLKITNSDIDLKNKSKFKIREFNNLAYSDNNEQYQINEIEEIYLNVQYQF